MVCCWGQLDELDAAQNRATSNPMLIAASAITASAVARIETPASEAGIIHGSALEPTSIDIFEEGRKQNRLKASDPSSLRYHFASALVSR